MKTLAAAVVAVCLPFAAFALTPPPPPPPQLAPEVAAAGADLGHALELRHYPAERQDEIWARYARKNQLSTNVLYPLGGAPLGGMGALGFPVEYERSINRSLSVLGVVQPTWRVKEARQTEFTWTLGAGARCYLSGNAPQGVWTGMQVDHALGGQAVTMRQELGHNAVFDNGLSLSFGVGLGITYARGVYVPFTNFEWLFFPAVGMRLNIGYAF